MVNHKSPIYLQLREIIRTKVEEGEYLPGTAIPSENELAEAYGINRLTVRNAVDTLVAEGLLKRVQGKGVYVLGQKVELDLERLAGFTQTMQDKKVKPSTHIVAKTLRPAGGKFSALFGIAPEDEVYYVKRVDYADDEPCSLEEIWIPKAIVPKLSGIDLTVFSLSEVYGFYDVQLHHAEQSLQITRLEQSDARTLGIDSELAVMLFTSVTYDKKNRVVEYCRDYTRADKCSFTVNFQDED